MGILGARWILAAALGAVTLPAGAAGGGWTKLSKPFQCEAPSDWASLSQKDLRLAGPDSGSGYKPMLTASFVKEGGEFSSAEDYVRKASGAPPNPGVAALVGGKSAPAKAGAEVSSFMISGRSAFRFETRDKFTREHPREEKGGAPGNWGPIPVRHLTVVVPAKKGFWVLRGSGAENDFESLRPVFDRFLASVRLK